MDKKEESRKTNPLIIKNQNLHLRKLEISDLDALFKLTSNEQVARFMRFNTHKNIEETSLLLKEYLENVSFAIEVTEQFVGVFILKPYVQEGYNDCYSISTFLDPAFWNKGYSQSILVLMKDYAKSHLQAKSLVAYAVDGNQGSQKALLKNNFYENQVLKFPDLPSKLIIYKCDL